MKRSTSKPATHFVDNYLINPTNPVIVSVIGAGGTGSQVVTALARMNYSLIQLGHPGLQVSVIDDDVVSNANIGRQLFAETEISLPKCVALVNRLNRFFGTNWKAIPQKITEDATSSNHMAQLTISCVDTVPARFTIARLLDRAKNGYSYFQRPIYWLDFGNGKWTGQMILSTVGSIEQPASRTFRTVKTLPPITEEFKQELSDKKEDRLPSCSLADALGSQDLFINSTLANIGCSLLWSMFREGMIAHRGLFVNLKNFQMLPIPLDTQAGTISAP